MTLPLPPTTQMQLSAADRRSGPNAQLKVGDLLKVTIRKFDPSRDPAPYTRSYRVPYTREMRVLEVLDYIVEELGDSLAYQWFCGVKKCGMCGVMVNGRQTLGCWEPVEPEMLIEPLPNFPVIRDLVIDRQSYFENTQKLQPVLVREKPYPGFPEPLTGPRMHAAAEMMHCIECMLCISACPSQGPQFMGPAPLVQLAKFALDPRDEGQRTHLARAAAGIDHCVSCYQCTRVCPADIPILEVAITGLRDQLRDQGQAKPASLRDRLFANIHTLSRWGSRLAPLANGVLRLPAARWVLERLAGIDRRRPLPRFASVPFDRWFAQRQRPAGQRPQVILFHDTFMTYNEPEIGMAATELLEAAGYQVSLVDQRRCCGRPMFSKGFVDEARASAEHNLRLLAPYAERGVPIVVCEPSCLSMLREDYLRLAPGAAAQRVASQAFSLEEFVAARAQAGELSLEFTDQPCQLLVHGHCHQKALAGIEPALRALGLPPKYHAAEIPTTCCGMAGSNGFECEHYERSLQAAEVALLPAVRQAGAEVEVVAAGISCRQQISHGAGRRARHPALVLRDALANGRRPRQTE
ncbi:MAG: 4Fe-4S dicluster domain-containing protein [Anaerolineales bacterium]|nr:4Fe-4S dicluster domain-containing protein [Anaerolineales bacterium]